MTRKADPEDLTKSQLLGLIKSVYKGSFNSFTRTELLDWVIHHPNSRFEHLLTTSNVLRMVEQNRINAQKAKKRAKKKATTYRRLAAKAVQAPQYDIEIEFSEDGETFGNSIDIQSNHTYQCRLRLRQHMGEFNCSGFALDWRKTTNLSWADGYSTRTYEEALSNPLVIARKVRTKTIAANTTAAVKVSVAERYL